MFDPLSSSIEYIRAGKLRALAVTTRTRAEALPDIPTVGDFVPGYEASTWYGVGAPKNTAVEIIEKLNREINAGLADPTMKNTACRRWAAWESEAHLRISVSSSRPRHEKWAKVVKFAAIKPE